MLIKFENYSAIRPHVFYFCKIYKIIFSKIPFGSLRRFRITKIIFPTLPSFA